MMGSQVMWSVERTREAAKAALDHFNQKRDANIAAWRQKRLAALTERRLFGLIPGMIPADAVAKIDREFNASLSIHSVDWDLADARLTGVFQRSTCHELLNATKGMADHELVAVDAEDASWLASFG